MQGCGSPQSACNIWHLCYAFMVTGTIFLLCDALQLTSDAFSALSELHTLPQIITGGNKLWWLLSSTHDALTR
jgi:hypothetical protein